MNRPNIIGSAIRLKRRGKSHFALKVEGVVEPATIKIERSDNNLLLFEGDVRVSNSNRRFAKIDVSPSAALSETTEKPEVLEEEVIPVTITITNAGGDSGSMGDEIIIDDPVPLEETDSTDQVSAAKTQAKSVKAASKVKVAGAKSKAAVKKLVAKTAKGSKVKPVKKSPTASKAASTKQVSSVKKGSSAKKGAPAKKDIPAKKVVSVKKVASAKRPVVKKTAPKSASGKSSSKKR